MAISLPETILFFDIFDPSGRAGLPAAAVTANQLQCHALGTVTALAVQDTAMTESIHPVDPDLLNNQARCLLEDTHIKAIKASGFYSTESVSVIAQIAADYDQVPLIVYLGQTFFNTLHLADHEEIEDITASVWDLLVPLAHTLVFDHTYLNQWTGDENGNITDTINSLLQKGLSHYLALSGTKHGSSTLYDANSSQLIETAFPGHHPEAGDITSTALCCYLAKGMPVLQATEKAIQYTHSLLEKPYSLGMGRPMPNRIHHD